MRMMAWEEERLLLFSAAELARRHRSAGLPLNAPEAVALICDAMLEAARAGRSYAQVEAAGLGAVAPGEVMDGVRELVDEVRLEVLLGDGTRLVVLGDPLGAGRPMAVDGPGAVVPAQRSVKAAGGGDGATAGDGRERRRLTVRSESRRTIRVSSHIPFDRVNPRLVFDRDAATGFRLDLAAGTVETWAPGEARDVDLVRFGGTGDERSRR